jgi:hypothetical protein
VRRELVVDEPGNSLSVKASELFNGEAGARGHSSCAELKRPEADLGARWHSNAGRQLKMKLVRFYDNEKPRRGRGNHLKTHKIHKNLIFELGLEGAGPRRGCHRHEK